MQSKPHSEVQEFYAGLTIFLTGTTGLVGKLVLEKLLRSCDDIKKIYVLVRHKKNQNAVERLQNVYNTAIFDLLKSTSPNFSEKVSVIKGDCLEPFLGLSEEDKNRLVQEVNVVIHCAATVNFNEKLNKAIKINLIATRDLIRMAKEMKNLKSFVYVSTAYAYSPNKVIKEIKYETKISGKNMIDIYKILDDDTIDSLTPCFLGEWPNTYTITKAFAEDILHTEGQGLPIAVIRPSMVIATIRESSPGYIDNWYGPNVIIAGFLAGIFRICLCAHKWRANFIPADLVSNNIICAGWYIANSTGNKIEYFNSAYSDKNCITFDDMIRIQGQVRDKSASVKAIWYPILMQSHSRSMYKIKSFLFHTIPAYIFDFLLICMGKRPSIVKINQKVEEFRKLFDYFLWNNFTFTIDNNLKLFSRLSKNDQKLFDFSTEKLNILEFHEVISTGIRVHLLKDSLNTLPEAKERLRKLRIAHYSLLVILLICIFVLLRNVLRLFLNF